METNTKDFAKLKKKISELNSHKLFEEGENFTHRELKIFMEYHVYAVWDFMSIVKLFKTQFAHQDIHGCQVNTQRMV